MTSNRFGALPPPDKRWQIGRTAASVAFVNQAEFYLLRDCVDKDEATRLHDFIEKIKKGEEVLMEFLTVEELLTRKA